MDAGTAKKLIEKNLSYDEVTRLTIKLVQYPSPQTELLESEPQVLALIRNVIKPELEQSGLKPFVDKQGNLILHIKGRQNADRLMLVGYAMCAAASTMRNPYSGEIVDGATFGGPLGTSHWKLTHHLPQASRRTVALRMAPPTGR